MSAQFKAQLIVVLLANSLLSACAHAKTIYKVPAASAAVPLPLISLEPYNPRTAWFYWNGIPARCGSLILNHIKIDGAHTGIYVGSGVCGVRANDIEIENTSIGIDDHGTNGKWTNIYGSTVRGDYSNKADHLDKKVHR